MEQAVFKLIDQNQNFEALLREAIGEVDFDDVSIPVSQLVPHSTPPSSPVTTQTSFHHLSIDACLSCIQAQCRLTGLPIPTVAANECVKEFNHLLQDHQRNEDEQQKRFDYLVALLNKLVLEQKLSRTYFTEKLSSKVQDLPLELLWQLHASSAVPLDQYIECILDRPAVLEKFARNFSEICSRPDEGNHDRETIRTGVLGVLVRCGYSTPDDGLQVNQGLAAKASQMILDVTVSDLVKLQKQMVTRTDEQSPIVHHVAELYQAVRCHPGLDKSTISSFTLRQLRNLLRSDREEFHAAIAKQHGEWTYGKAPQSMKSMLTQLLLANTDKQIYTVLHQALQDDTVKVNWQHTLVLVSVFCVCFKEGSSFINGLVSSLLDESFESCQDSYLYTAFLLARQAAAEGSCGFPTYSQWFQKQFCTATSYHLASTKTFTFFMEFLKSLVPHEPEHCLKTHVHHPPCVSLKSHRELLMDYIDLAKTRLADFRDGSCGGPSTGRTSQTGNQAAVEDVERSVTAFEKTGRIPLEVLKSRNFRRSYYIGEFLPTLLSPRMLPDVPDSKMKLIDAIKSTGKLPSAMYERYTAACQQELSMLLEGVSSEDMDDMTFDPMDRLKELLDALQRELLTKDATEASSNAEIADKLSLISGKVTALLSDLAPRDNPDFILIDIQEMTSTLPLLMKVTDLLLGCYCKTYTMMVRHQRQPAPLAAHFSSLLAAQGSLHHPLYHRLFTLICHQDETLSDMSEDHVISLAVLLVHMSALGKRLPDVKLQTHDGMLKEEEEEEEGPDRFSLLNLISRELQHRSGRAMELTLRFCTAVLESLSGDLKAKSNDIVPFSLKQKFCYLQPRKQFTSLPRGSSSTPSAPVWGGTNMAENTVASSSQSDSSSSSGFQGCLPRKHQLTLDEWLEVELRVHSCQDYLTEYQRTSYHHWVMYNSFLPHLMHSAEGTNPSGAYRTACSKILNAVLDYGSEPSCRSVQQCPHGARQGHPVLESGRISCGLGRDIIQLLQELLLVWSTSLQKGTSQPGTDTDCSWLLRELETRLKNLSDQKTGPAMALEVSNQMMVIQCLQPHLLLVDCLWQIPSRSAIEHLTSYINTHLKEYVQDGFCSFQYEVVSILFQGAMQLYTHTAQQGGASDERVNEVMTAISDLIGECPLLTVSILSHWDVLSPMISKMSPSGPQTNPSTILNQLQTIIHEVCSDDAQQIFPPDDGIQEVSWILIISPMKLLQSRRRNADDLSRLQENLICKLKEIYEEDEIRQDLFEYHIAEAAWLLLSSPSDSTEVVDCMTVASSLLSKSPSCLKACTGDSVMKSQVLPSSVIKLYPVVCFRILLQRESQGVLRQACADPQLLTVLLYMYASLVTLHCQQPITDQHLDSRSGDHQIVDFEFLQSSLALVRGVIKKSSRENLAAVDVTALANSNPELTDMILQSRGFFRGL